MKKQNFLMYFCVLVSIASLNGFAFATDVGGIIGSDTMWSISESPYNVTDNITVLPGNTLTVEAGVVIKFNGSYRLRINGGTLNVNGIENNKVVFTSNQGSPSAGNWDTILFESESVGKIEHAIIQHATKGVTIVNDSPTISNCEFLNNSHGIYISETDSSPSITNCNISNNTYGIYGSWAGWSTKITVSGCKISANSDSGIYNDESGFHIEKSDILNNTTYGIFSNHSSEIQNNTIKSNGIGIYSSMGWHTISYNEIVNNSNGVKIGGYPIRTVLNYNTLYDNTEFDIVYEGGYDEGEVDAKNNWWNTTDTEQIENRIWDIYDDSNLGGWIAYNPILTSPPVPDNESPVANSGNDQIVFDEIVFDGSQSQDSDGEIISYQWNLQHRENSAYNKTAEGVNPKISNLEKGFWDVTLTVTDDDGSTGTDVVFFSATGTKCFKGDINNDGKIGLEEAIYALKIVSGINP